jgi:hypothetical protein
VKSFGQKMIRAVVGRRLLAAAMAATILFPLCHALSQSSLPPDEAVESGRKKATITLSQDELRLATDYLEILKQLEMLTEGYGNYFDRLQINVVGDERRRLDLIASRLKEGSYLENMEGVEADMTALLKELSEKKKELGDRNEKAFRLSLSLQQELAALKNLLDQEILPRVDESSDTVLRACALLAAKSFGQLSQPGDIYRLGEHGVIVIPMKIGDSDVTKMVYVVPPVEVPIVLGTETLSVFSLPQPPSVSGSRDTEFLLRSGARAAIREFVDSIEVSSTKQPIYISNPIGDLEVQGWDNKQVLVRSTIELSADSRLKATEQVQQVALQLCPKGDGIGVELLVPNLSDPKTKIVKNSFKIKVPKQNPLVCTNSFGEVTVSRMQNDVKISASYSRVDVDWVEGRTDVANTMGEVHLSRITGPIKVTNSYSPIEMTQCRGDMEIDNAFSSIELTKTEGNIVIRNSGPIAIARHSGTIQIENKNGQVEVLKLDGDVTIQNSFQSLSIEDIFGSAKVNNANGNITAKNVTGEFSANNVFGRIYGDLLYGPVHVTCHNGTVDLTLAEKVSGPSTIDATLGTVKVGVFPYSDLLLTLTAVGGNIQSYFPVTIDESGLTKTATLSFGKGTNAFTVSGNNSTIIIAEAK